MRAALTPFPAPLRRLACWIHAAPLRWSMLGNSLDAVATEAHIARLLAQIQGETLSPEAEATARAQLELHRVELLSLERRYEALLDCLFTLEQRYGL